MSAPYSYLMSILDWRNGISCPQGRKAAMEGAYKLIEYHQALVQEVQLRCSIWSLSIPNAEQEKLEGWFCFIYNRMRSIQGMKSMLISSCH
jgi:hypothetical protein